MANIRTALEPYDVLVWYGKCPNCGWESDSYETLEEVPEFCKQCQVELDVDWDYV